jgi:hypothetical protein
MLLPHQKRYQNYNTKNFGAKEQVRRDYFLACPAFLRIISLGPFRHGGFAAAKNP